MICQRCAKERAEIHTCSPSQLVRDLEQQRDELLRAAGFVVAARNYELYLDYWVDQLAAAIAKVKQP